MLFITGESSSQTSLFQKLDACFVRSSPSYETLHTGSYLDTRREGDGLSRKYETASQQIKAMVAPPKSRRPHKLFCGPSICQKRQLREQAEACRNNNTLRLKISWELEFKLFLFPGSRASTLAPPQAISCQLPSSSSSPSSPLLPPICPAHRNPTMSRGPAGK